MEDFLFMLAPLDGLALIRNDRLQDFFPAEVLARAEAAGLLVRDDACREGSVALSLTPAGRHLVGLDA